MKKSFTKCLKWFRKILNLDLSNQSYDFMNWIIVFFLKELKIEGFVVGRWEKEHEAGILTN